MTDPDLKALALKIAEGKVYGTWNVPPDLAPMVFMPLALLDDAGLAQIREAAHVYAIVGEDHTFDRAVNGYPIFSSMRVLSKADAEKLGPLVKAAEAAREAFLK